MNYNVKKPTVKGCSLGAANTAREEAERLYKEVRDKYAAQVVAMLESMDKDEVMLNKDIARAAGITPAHAAQILEHPVRRSPKVGFWTAHTTTRYAEVDEDGKLVEGGKVCEKHSNCLAYRRLVLRQY